MLAFFTFAMMGIVMGGAFAFHIGLFTGWALAYTLLKLKVEGQK